MTTTFENSREGDRVYSPLFKSKNPDDKTNAVIITTNEKTTGIFKIGVKPDIGKDVEPDFYFSVMGEYVSMGGQCLFWEKPFEKIPTQPKRKIKKVGFISVFPMYSNCPMEEGRIALATHIYDTEEGVRQHGDGQIIKIEFDGME
jgi:hypothetical protein